MKDRRYSLAIASLAIAYFVVLWWTAPTVGVTRDESYYFKAAEEYGQWWEILFSARFFDAFSDAEIERCFSYNTEHPALVKLALGLGYRFFHDLLGVASNVQAYRATGFFFGALSLISTFLLGRAVVSAPVGLLAAALLAALPRYFYDAHLACFDVPMTAMWSLGLWAFWRALVAPPRAGLGPLVTAGLVFGLCLATKLQGLFLPLIFLAVWLWRTPWSSLLRLRPGPSGGTDLLLPPIPWVLVFCAILGPIVFYLHWPHLWHAPFTRTGTYLAFHLGHEHYPVSYFHELLVKPPFPIAFPFVMSALTIPAPLLVLGTLGLLAAFARMWSRRSTGDFLLVLATLLPVLLIAMPSTPHFGGVKHWYNAMPTFAILAARGLWMGAQAVQTLARPRGVRFALGAALALVAVAPGALGIIASHPHGIGFYNELAGGIRGGAELGMQRVFWGGAGDPLFPVLGGLPPRSQVFFNRSTYDAWRMHRREGKLREDVYYANEPKGNVAAGVAFMQPEHAERIGEIWSNLGTRPVAGVYVDNVPLTELYVRGQSNQGP